uniref:sodium/calcium exchanger 3-like isoform X2 n=1 Tax=Myxine glutinosa TaxID=7769 RepID=UPI00358EED87
MAILRLQMVLALGLLLTMLSLKVASLGGDTTPTESMPSAANATCSGSSECKKGVLLPPWLPVNPSTGDKVARAVVYIVGLVYMFLGVSIIADRFMASIEVITSQEKEITIQKPGGETITTTVRIWNETVSNLTLMALGSSAPEILLSLIEVCGHNFEAGELGPSTIVGSAAFNMFVIIAICVYVIPDGETRKIKHLRVFFVTATWSVFAYIWLYLILEIISPGIVQVWEGIVTFLFFPLCVSFAWVADRRLLFYKYMYKRYRTHRHRNIIIETEGERPKNSIEMDGKILSHSDITIIDGAILAQDDKDVEESRRNMIRILKELKHKHPDKDMDQLTEIANYYMLNQQQKSRAFYRIQATRMMTGAGNILKKHVADQTRRAVSVQSVQVELKDDHETKICFDPCTYQCLENCGTCAVTVLRRGGELNNTIYVDYKTEDGSANAGSDYEYKEGTMVFKPGETEKDILIGIIDDDIFEEDEHFYVRLSNVRTKNENNQEANHTCAPNVQLVNPCVAVVTILDDDHAGVFGFEDCTMHISESIGIVEVKVLRCSGARGIVRVPFRTLEGSAKGNGEDFEDVAGELEFHNDEVMKSIEIRIIDDEEYEKNKSFFLELGTPRLMEMSEKKGGKDVVLTEEEEEARRIAELGKPSLCDNHKLEIIIEESYEFKSTVDKLIKKTNLALVVGTHTWREQFVEAITVSAGDDEEEDGTEEKMPSCCDYIMHFLTVFWKVLFACVPPTEYWNGWACFVISILVIGFLTAIIGDLASHFGCTVGLKDSVTAVVFVALGTSVPDLFASKVAAAQDQYADASIGNVTGSNAVNIFLGIGVAWSVAAIYWESKGKYFRVDPGKLAFSVTLFTIFAFINISVLMYRRIPKIGGELGGPRLPKIITSCFFVFLWLIYILFSSLAAYCHFDSL